MNDFRIARNDDETFTDEDTFVSERRDALVHQWLSDRSKVEEALGAALENGDLDVFADRLTQFFCALDGQYGLDVNSAAFGLRGSLMYFVRSYLIGEADSQARSEWDNRQTGAPE